MLEPRVPGGLQKQLLAIHGAVQPEALGNAVVRLIESLMPTRAVSFVLRPLEFVMPLMYARPEHLPLFQKWVSQHHEYDLWLERCPMADRPRIVRHTDHTPDSVMVRSRFYKVACAPHEIRYGVGLVVWRGAAPLAFVQILRRTEQGDFTDAEMKQFAVVYPHIATAVRRIFLLHGERATRLSLEKFLDSLPEAMVLLDSELKIVHHNSAAAEICAKWSLGPPMARALKRNGRFDLPPDVLEECRQLGELPSGKAHLYTKPGQSRLSCRIRRVQLHSSALHRPMFILRFDDAKMMPAGRDSAEIFCARSALTPRERELALLVCEGRTNREIAQRLCKSAATVRNQLHSIYEKLHISRRAQLIAHGWN